ncbi:hypothetical protein L6164_018131 [Bauhinia variegata]|uniref:Uncharacterized protein n=1 Tax=Bauhinia variegata TaxID=167791 RepID=A0ACB9NDN4_BAUVA|nr:hypothetical protein L6164_018131 [Bauhinia variegata]
MTRGKVKLQLIANESTRRAAFRKRKKGLLKKVDELTKLCGVEIELADLDDMGVMLDQKLRKIRARLESLNKAEAESQAQVTI